MEDEHRCLSFKEPNVVTDLELEEEEEEGNERSTNQQWNQQRAISIICIPFVHGEKNYGALHMERIVGVFTYIIPQIVQFLHNVHAATNKKKKKKKEETLVMHWSISRMRRRRRRRRRSHSLLGLQGRNLMLWRRTWRRMESKINATTMATMATMAATTTMIKIHLHNFPFVAWRELWSFVGS